MKLFRHQEVMLSRLRTMPYCINGSEAGTGKTLPAIKFLEELEGQSLVVCPAFLCHNWLAEISRFSAIDAALYTRNKAHLGAKVLVVSYNKLHSLTQIYPKYLTTLSCIVADESHYLNTTTTQRTKAFHKIIRKHLPDHLKMLTGTVMRNRIPELYSALSLLDYWYERGFLRKYPTQWAFNNRFTHPEKVNIGSRTVTKFEGYRNLDELKDWLGEYYFKFTLDEIESLPTLSKSSITVPAVDRATDDLLKDAWKNSNSEYISTVKAASAMLKTKHTVEILKNELDNGSRPILVFSDHVEPCETMAKLLEDKYRCAVITGKTPMLKRHEIVGGYQAQHYDILFGSIGAMGTGLTLTASNLVVFNDRSWVPANNMQAEKRIHRISQTRHCRVIDVVRPGVDYMITAQLIAKESIIEKVV